VRQKLALGAMLGGSVAFLLSLYFDWLNEADCHYAHFCFAIHNDPSIVKDGWTGFGQIAAVVAVALAAGACAAAANRELATRLPLGWLAVALGIFALLSVSELWTNAIGANASFGFNTVGLGPGAYIGLAGVGVAGAGAVAARWSEITRRSRRATAAAGTLITLALIAAFVLPALNARAEAADNFTVQLRGGLSTFICAFACLGLLAWQGRRPGPRLATAAAIGTLVAAHLLPYRHDYAQWPYELWLEAACAAGLLVLGLLESRSLRLRRPDISELAIVAGSVLLLVSLFLPWQSLRDSGSYYSQRGWQIADLAGVFALGLLLALVWTGRVVRELAFGAAIFVLTAGVATATFSISNANVLARKAPPSHLNFAYGAPLGFAGAALVVAFSLGRFRTIPDKRLLVRGVPILAALALLAVAVAPNALNVADILDKTDRFGLKSPFVTLLLLGAITILLTLRLVARWFDGAGDQTEVVSLPLALLALTTLTVIHDHVVTTTIPTLGFVYGKGISWEGWVAIFLCLLLVACGWVARRGIYPRARTDGSASTTSLAMSP